MVYALIGDTPNVVVEDEFSRYDIIFFLTTTYWLGNYKLLIIWGIQTVNNKVTGKGMGTTPIANIRFRPDNKNRFISQADLPLTTFDALLFKIDLTHP